MESRKDNPKHPDESCQKEKNGRNFRRTIRKSTSLGERLARGGVKKYRVKLSNLKNCFHYHYAFGHFVLKNPSKVRARKMAKNSCSSPAIFERRRIKRRRI